MTNNRILFLFILTLLSCYRKGDSGHDDRTSFRYFEYSSIDYYSIEIDEEELGELYANQTISRIDSLKLGVITQRIPESMRDTSAITQFQPMGFAKSEIDSSKFKSIDKIFSEKQAEDFITTSCIRIYRDILVFRNGNRVEGIAKFALNVALTILSEQMQRLIILDKEETTGGLKPS